MGHTPGHEGFFSSPEVRGAAVTAGAGLLGGAITGIAGLFPSRAEREQKRQFEKQFGLQERQLGLQERGFGLEQQAAFRQFQEEDRKRRFLRSVRQSSKRLVQRALPATLAGRAG